MTAILFAFLAGLVASAAVRSQLSPANAARHVLFYESSM